MPKEKYKVVHIVWEDALSRDGWSLEKDAVDWAKERSKEVNSDIGWLIEKTKDYVLISTSYSEITDQVDYIKKIPTGTIKKIKVINI